MQKLTLDYSKWRCGKDGDKSMGKGYTNLENDEGFQCCLGQFALQLGANEEYIRNYGTPAAIRQHIPLLNKPDDYRFFSFSFKNTDFSKDAMVINDNENTTPEQKIELLTALCLANDIELEVINLPNNE
jgi:hypothetical protein